MKWKVVAKSAIGTSHEKQNIGCQDYCNYVIDDDTILGAVADGAGSAKYSEIGAKLAVETALSELKKWRKWLKTEKFDLQPDILPEKAQRAFQKTLSQVVTALKAETSKGYNLKDLACTLLVFVGTPEWIAAMQIGDGFIVVGLQDSDDYQLIFQPDKGEYANETTFVTSDNASQEMRVRLVQGNQQFICASTDGLERLAIDMRNWMPSSRFFKPFEDGLMRDIKQEEESVISWLNCEEVNAKTDDDKTLLLCLYTKDRVENKPHTSKPSLGGRLGCKSNNRSRSIRKHPKPNISQPNKNSSQKSSRFYGNNQTFIPGTLAGVLLHINYFSFISGSYSKLVTIFIYIYIGIAIWSIVKTHFNHLPNQLQKQQLNFLSIAFTFGIGALLGWLIFYSLWFLSDLIQL